MTTGNPAVPSDAECDKIALRAKIDSGGVPDSELDAMMIRAGAAWQAARTSAQVPVAGCLCETCVPQGDIFKGESMRFITCGICGNKRCPHAANHRNACTDSNEPGQQGSNYATPPAAPVPARDAAGNFIGNPTDPAWEESMAAPVEPPCKGLLRHRWLTTEHGHDICEQCKITRTTPPAQDAELIRRLRESAYHLRQMAQFVRSPGGDQTLAAHKAAETARLSANLLETQGRSIAALTAEIVELKRQKTRLQDQLEAESNLVIKYGERAEKAEAELAQAMRVVEAARNYHEHPTHAGDRELHAALERVRDATATKMAALQGILAARDHGFTSATDFAEQLEAWAWEMYVEEKKP